MQQRVNTEGSYNHEQNMMTDMRSNNIELADGGLLVTTVLVKPLPIGGHVQDSTVVGHPTIRLRGPVVGCVPVLV